MLAVLLLAAGMSVASPRAHRQYPRSVDQRVALLEAKELLNSQQIWMLQAHLPPETIRALEDVQLHLRQDAEQEEHVRALTAEVQALQARLASLEMIVRGSMPEGNVIPVAPTQQIEPPKKTKATRKRKHGKRPAAVARQ
jgi:hypothetical protein